MKKGFTLVEILTIIAIIGLLIMVAIPNVLDSYRSAEKKKFNADMLNLVRAAEIGFGNTSMNTMFLTDTTYTFTNGEMTIDSGNIEFEISGETPKDGTLTITKDGEVSLDIYNGKYNAVKRKNSNKITISEITMEEWLAGPSSTPEECFITTIESGSVAEFLYSELSGMPPEFEELYYYEFGLMFPDNLESNEAIVYYYDYENEECPSDIIMPEEVNGKTIVGIWPYSFVVFDFDAFEAESGMGITSIEFPNSLKIIGAESFMRNLLTDLNFKNVEVIGMNAFAYNSLVSVTLPSNIISIGPEVFIYNQLTNISIPSINLSSISSYAFAGNYITEARICNLSSSATIAEDAFAYNGSDMETTIIPTFTSDVCP